MKYMALINTDGVEITPGERPEWWPGKVCRFTMGSSGVAGSVAIAATPVGLPTLLLASMNPVAYEKGDTVCATIRDDNVVLATGLEVTCNIMFKYENAEPTRD